MSGYVNGANGRPATTPPPPLDRAGVEATLQPLERASMLPPSSFTDAGVFEWELESLFCGGWICAAHVSAMAEPGAYVMREIGGESFFVIRGRTASCAASSTSAGHRGARILSECEGKVRARITCPYHAWSYGLDGSLQGTRHTESLVAFDPACHGLSPVAVGVVGGLVLVNLSAAPTPVGGHVGELEGWLERYSLGRLEPGGRRDYEVRANWKAIAENYNECLHCPGVHAELNAFRLRERRGGRGRRRVVRRLDDA